MSFFEYQHSQGCVAKHLRCDRILALLQIHLATAQILHKCTLKCHTDSDSNERVSKCPKQQDKKTVLSQGNRAMPQLFFSV